MQKTLDKQLDCQQKNSKGKRLIMKVSCTIYCLANILMIHWIVTYG